MGKPISLTNEQLHHILDVTFSKRTTRPKDLDLTELKSDIVFALAARRITFANNRSELGSKSAGRVLQRFDNALSRLVDVTKAAAEAGLITPISAALENPSPGQLEEVPFSAWVEQSDPYLNRLKSLIARLDSEPKKRGARFGSADRLWVGHTLAGVYQKHFGGGLSVNGPWGRFLSVISELNEISLSPSATEASLRSNKKLKGNL